MSLNSRFHASRIADATRHLATQVGNLKAENNRLVEENNSLQEELLAKDHEINQLKKGIKNGTKGPIPKDLS